VMMAAISVLSACGGSDGGSAGATTDSPPTDSVPAASGPRAAVEDDRLHGAPLTELPARIQMLADTGAAVTRVGVWWRDIAPTPPADPADPADPAYDFSRYDLIIRELASHGVSALVSVYNAPEWAAGSFTPGINDQVNAQAPDPDAFGAFMGALATRYSGSFEADGAALPTVDLFEIWNEGNLAGFLFPQTEKGERVVLDTYANMTRAAYDQIKDANPEATVIAGVTGPRGKSNERNTGVEDWIAGLADRDVPMDAYSQHVYPVAAPAVETEAFPAWATIDRLTRAVDRLGGDLPIYITEAGYTTMVTPFRDAGATATEAEQAQYVREIYSLPQLQTGRFPLVVWFNLQDNPGWPAGLIDINGRKKPSHAAFLDVAKGAAAPG
ncbi:MAG: hypothetical protein OER93_01835, partial [Thermoleophilia bacterium]|nr:hypothetical protein [Thermoleophilia bacterium]